VNSAEQISFDDLTKENSIQPNFDIGQTVYICELDLVRTAVVNSYFACNPKDNSMYHGYCVTCIGGGRRTIYDYSIGSTVFHDEKCALERASLCCCEKIDTKMLKPQECVSYEYVRACDNYKLIATIGKIGELQLLEKKFYCYTFLRTYRTEKERDSNYKKLLQKMEDEAKANSGELITMPNLGDLYKVGDVYASHGYAFHNMPCKCS